MLRTLCSRVSDARRRSRKRLARGARLEDSISVSHRISKELRRLCQCLVYITAVRIRPASWKRFCDDKRTAVETLPGAGERSAGSDMTKSALDLIGRVLG